MIEAGVPGIDDDTEVVEAGDLGGVDHEHAVEAQQDAGAGGPVVGMQASAETSATKRPSSRRRASSAR